MRVMLAVVTVVVVALGALLMWLATPARAMGMCGLRADFVAALNGKYSETRKAVALAGQTSLVEVFNSKAGTWTILVTTPDGMTCIIAAGKGWEDLPVEIEGSPS